ncbi:MAG: DNRLRE domain-containing protein [Chloroflexota bacterium]|nr:DNRLRE domain-containing protein [Chloroflexota bacterium]
MTRTWLRVLLASAGILVGSGVLTGSADSLSLTSQNFTPYRTCTITATPTTTTAVADTTARQGSPTSNFGTNSVIAVQSGVNLNIRLYIWFDLTRCSPLIPSSATVRLATLRLYMTAAPAECRVLDIFRVTASWGETTLTWNNQPFGTAINNPPTASRTGTFSVGTPVGCQNRATGVYVTGGTVTADVARFVAGSATNFGWMIRDDAEGSATTRASQYSAKEVGTVPQEPQLVITYVPVP